MCFKHVLWGKSKHVEKNTMLISKICFDFEALMMFEFLGPSEPNAISEMLALLQTEKCWVRAGPNTITKR